jgi:hypothetical protein
MSDRGAASQLAVGLVVNTPLGRGIIMPDGPMWQPREEKWTCSVRLNDIYVHAFYCDDVTPVECEDPTTQTAKEQEPQ